jgi:Dynamin central region
VPGVLTKVDRIGDGEHEDWIDLLQDRTERLTHGYYATCQPSTAKRTEGEVTWKEARKMESAFFTTPELWSSVNKSRLGTSNLMLALSLQLTKMIQKRYLSGLLC